MSLLVPSSILHSILYSILQYIYYKFTQNYVIQALKHPDRLRH